MIERLPKPQTELSVRAALAAPAPDPAFVEGLRRQLRARAVALEAVAAAPRPGWRLALGALRRHRWAVGALAVALVLALALAVAGPRRVLAQFQRLLGYVPGVGFMDLDATRVLTAPVQVTRDGVTLRVTQVLAQPDRTVLVYEAEGLPPYTPGRDVSAALRLPDGTRLLGTSQSVGRGADTAHGGLRFPPLPEGVYQATLLLERLPYVRAGDAPEDWEVPLTLRLATGELVAELFPQPYAPPGAEDSQQGISLRVLVVAHSPEATVLKLRAEWADPAWRFGYFTGGNDPRLLDDVGHLYGAPPPTASMMSVEVVAVAPPPPPGETVTPDPGRYRAELEKRFASLSPSATHLELEVDSVTFDVPITGEFEVDLGPRPQVGDYIPLDVAIDAAGVPVRITGARLEQMAMYQVPAETWLRFDIAAEPAADGRSVRALHLNLGTSMPAFDGASSNYDWGTGRLSSGLRFVSDQPLPAGPLRIQLAAASLVVPGPWNLSWDVPGRAAPPSAPVTLAPAGAAQTRGGLTLRAESVTLTDRVTVVRLGLPAAPAGTRLNAATCWLPEQTTGPGCWLEDNRGQRYADPGVSWRTAARPLTDTLIFDAAQPLAHSMTLHLPAVEVAVAGAASFDVEVPPEAADLPLNRPWPVDIAVEVAGQALRFTEARLIETDGLPQLVLRTGPLAVPRDRWLTGLRLATLTGPGGAPVDLAQAHSTAGPDFFSLDREYVASIIFPVAAADQRSLQPGRYHVDLSGATFGVRGPWVLSWEMP